MERRSILKAAAAVLLAPLACLRKVEGKATHIGVDMAVPGSERTVIGLRGTHIGLQGPGFTDPDCEYCNGSGSVLDRIESAWCVFKRCPACEYLRTHVIEYGPGGYPIKWVDKLPPGKGKSRLEVIMERMEHA